MIKVAPAIPVTPETPSGLVDAQAALEKIQADMDLQWREAKAEAQKVFTALKSAVIQRETQVRSP